MGSLRVRFRQSRDVRGVFGYALEACVVSSESIPSKIFVYHQSPPGLDGNTISQFDHVATPVDFQEIPEDAASEIVPWYRTDRCTIWVRSVDDLRIAKQLMIDDVIVLQRTYDALSRSDDFVNEDTIEFSDGSVKRVDDGSSSSSDSGSDSGSDSSSFS